MKERIYILMLLWNPYATIFMAVLIENLFKNYYCLWLNKKDGPFIFVQGIPNLITEC